MPETLLLSKDVSVIPVRADQWPDLEKLFGKHGAAGGCWCMFWRMNRADFKQAGPEGRKIILQGLAEADDVPGVLAYVDGEAAGWCSIGPRERYLALENSRLLKRIDEQPVWSVVCFYVGKAYRKRNLLEHLLAGAVHYAISQGAGVIEGYPIDMQAPLLEGKRLTGYSGYMGIASVYRKLGFVEAGRASETQVIMRYTAAG